MASSSPTNTTNLASVNIDSLIIGRKLTCSVYDKKGTLLIAAGLSITPDLKQRLKRRGVHDVLMHPDDVAKATLTAKSDAVPDSGPVFDDTVTARVQSAISTCLVGCQNRGPAVRDRLVRHGRKAYDAKQNRALAAQHRAASGAIGDMMTQVGGEQEIRGSEVVELTAQCLSSMTADAESLLSSAMGTSFDQSLADHAVKLSVLAMALAVEMGLDEDSVRTIGIIGLVQDFGMMRIPKEIRESQCPLSRQQVLDLQKHTRYTVDIVERISGLPSIVPLVVLQTHERYDGSGYPQGRSGTRIHPFARLLSVADSYIALTSPRPTRPPLMAYSAMECLLRLARRKVYDPNVVRALLNLLTLFPIGSYVAMSDGSVARVIRRSGADYTAPIVQVIQDSHGVDVDPAELDWVFDLTESELQVVQALPTPGREETSLAPIIESLQL